MRDKKKTYDLEKKKAEWDGKETESSEEWEWQGKKKGREWDYPWPFTQVLIHTLQYCRQESTNLLYDTVYRNT